MNNSILTLPLMPAFFLSLFGSFVIAAERYEELRGQAFSDPDKR